ncbi:MAG: hypothetical protein Kow0069_24620 [Promethearchaeota archaeon]
MAAVVLAGGVEVPLWPVPSFTTFPPPGTPWKFDVAFGGGAGYTQWHERQWTTIATSHPSAFLALGDNVYVDTPEVPATQKPHP